MKTRIEIVLLFLLALVAAYAFNTCLLLLNLPSDAAVAIGVFGIGMLIIFVPLLVMYLIRKFHKENKNEVSSGASSSNPSDTGADH
jgi:Zn-dependent protease with chaperone function